MKDVLAISRALPQGVFQPAPTAPRVPGAPRCPSNRFKTILVPDAVALVQPQNVAFIRIQSRNVSR